MVGQICVKFTTANESRKRKCEMYYLKIWNSSPSLATAGFFVAYSNMPNWNMNPLRFLNECRNPKAFA